MIKDSYSVPHWKEFDWSTVEWDSPLPNDLVALAEMTRDAQAKYFDATMRIVAAGGTYDDSPSLSQWTWDYVVVPVGLGKNELSAEQYERFGRFLMAGEYVRDDRMFREMTDDEMQQHFAESTEIADFVSREVDLAGAAKRAEERMRQRNAEIDLLRNMLNED